MDRDVQRFGDAEQDTYQMPGRGLAMSSLMSSVKHVRYMMGSLTAVLFAGAAGGNF